MKKTHRGYADKRHHALKLTREAALTRHAVRYKVLSQVLHGLENASAEKVARLRKTLCNASLLVLDHVGEDVISPEGGTFLRDLVDERHHRQRATVFVSSRHPNDWVHAFENADTGHAIVTRVVDHALVIELRKPQPQVAKAKIKTKSRKKPVRRGRKLAPEVEDTKWSGHRPMPNQTPMINPFLHRPPKMWKGRAQEKAATSAPPSARPVNDRR